MIKRDRIISKNNLDDLRWSWLSVNDLKKSQEYGQNLAKNTLKIKDNFTWSFMIQNDAKWSKMIANDAKWCKMILNDARWSQKSPKIPKWSLMMQDDP